MSYNSTALTDLDRAFIHLTLAQAQKARAQAVTCGAITGLLQTARLVVILLAILVAVAVLVGVFR